MKFSLDRLELEVVPIQSKKRHQGMGKAGVTVGGKRYGLPTIGFQ